MHRKTNPVVPMFNDYGAPIAAKEPTWRSLAFGAAAELATICKAGPRQRGSKGWVLYRLDICPLTGEFYGDAEPFADVPEIMAHRDGIVIFMMGDLPGDHLHKLVAKLRAAGHALPKMTKFGDAVLCTGLNLNVSG